MSSIIDTHHRAHIKSWYPLLLLEQSFVLISHSCGRVDESEDVVEDVVAARVVGQKLECLDVAHGPPLLLNLESRSVRSLYPSDYVYGYPHQQSTAHNDQDSAARVTGLGIESRDLVFDLGKGKCLQLLDNLTLALAGRGLECEHGVILLRGMSVLSILVARVSQASHT